MQPGHLRSLALGFGLVVTSALTTGPLNASAGAPEVPDATLTAKLAAATDGHVRFARHDATGLVSFAGSDRGKPLAKATGGDPVDAADRYLAAYGKLFGVAGSTDLGSPEVHTGAGDTVGVRYDQRYRGLPVLGGEVAVQVAGNGAVLSTTAEVSPALALDTTPAVAPEAAIATAVAATSKYDGPDPAELTTDAPELAVYDSALLGAPGRHTVALVWQVEAYNALGDVDRLVLVDAHTGAIALTFSQVEHALSRKVCDAGNTSSAVPCSTAARVEGQGPAGTSDVNDAYDHAGSVYQWYLDVLGRDSIDGAGMELVSTVRYCDPGAACPYFNAFWTDQYQQMVYGQCQAYSDDTAAHEMTHGVTSHESNLFYYAESGAINESLSDVFGELVDQAYNTYGTDTPGEAWVLFEDDGEGCGDVGYQYLRSMKDPTSPEGAGPMPDRMTSGYYWTDDGDNYGVHSNSGVGNKAAYLIAAGDTFNGQTITGIGNGKTARIYYEAQTNMLTSGSDYGDLAQILQQACTNLVGQAGITGGDCEQVRKAVLATEMATPSPLHQGAEAAPCDSGQTPATTAFAEGFEATPAFVPAFSGAAVFGFDETYVHGGLRAVWGGDTNPNDATSIGLAAMTSDVFTVPVSPTGAYLWFAHNTWFERDDSAYYDGGVVEYSTDGSTWIDALTLPTAGQGYAGVIDAGYGNPLGGRAAFSGLSVGYVSTRVDLTSLAGQDIRIRFLIGLDDSNASDWLIDDVAVYSCESAPTGAPAGIVAVNPARLFDSRNGAGRIPAGGSLPVTVTGGQVPGDANGVLLNVTAVNPDAPGYVTAYPCGGQLPATSNVNFTTAGAVAPNSVFAKVGTNGQVCFYASTTTDLIVDINGYT